MTPKLSIFSPDQLSRIVNDTLVDLPSDHKNAIVGSVDTHGAQVVAGFTLGQDNTWKLEGAYRHSWDTGEDTVGGKVIVSW
jgi:hypothetical protein